MRAQTSRSVATRLREPLQLAGDLDQRARRASTRARAVTSRAMPSTLPSAAGARRRGQGELDDVLAAGGVGDAERHAAHRLAGARAGQHRGCERRSSAAAGNARKGRPSQSAQTESQDALECGIERREGAVGPDREDDVGRAFDQRAVARLGIAQRRFGAGALAALPAGMQRAPDHRREAVEMLLEHVVGGAEPEPLDRRLLAERAGDQDEREIGPPFAQQARASRPSKAGSR